MKSMLCACAGDLRARRTRLRECGVRARLARASATRSSRSAATAATTSVTTRLTLALRPGDQVLDGHARITATATQDLSRFDLDLRGFDDLRASPSTARAASFVRDGQELIITPATGIPAGSTFTVDVRYAGVPPVVTDPDGSIEGWIPTDDGAFVVGEPQGSPGWFPVNDNPRDKATYDVRGHRPGGPDGDGQRRARLLGTANGKTTWVWREDEPMATYLATSTLGRFDLTHPARSPTASRPTSPSIRSWPRARCCPSCPRSSTTTARSSAPTRSTSVGAIVDDAKVVGYSLETQTKPNFPYVPDEATLVHELAHQWYGDSVTLTQWPDIWLHEGFATWAEWIWSEHAGQQVRRPVLQAALQHAGQGHGASGTRRRAIRASPRASSTARSTTAAR